MPRPHAHQNLNRVPRLLTDISWSLPGSARPGPREVHRDVVLVSQLQDSAAQCLKRPLGVYNQILRAAVQEQADVVGVAVVARAIPDAVCVLAVVQVGAPTLRGGVPL